jgi:hypothetical protein
LLTRYFTPFGLLLALALMMTACAVPPTDVHIPPFARVPYQAFSREAAIQIAYREWRAFGQPVVSPHTELPFDKDRVEGLWQRVAEYRWFGLPLRDQQQGFTRGQDENGPVFSAREQATDWSAAFIDYVMRMAGARDHFLYSPTDSDFINAAWRHGMGMDPNRGITAERPESYAPQRGDLICMWRGPKQIRYDDLPTGRFPAHCDIVVAIQPGILDVIGGNVDHSVSMKQIPVTADGHLANTDRRIVDHDHPWFVVLRLGYEI